MLPRFMSCHFILTVTDYIYIYIFLFHLSLYIICVFLFNAFNLRVGQRCQQAQRLIDRDGLKNHVSLTLSLHLSLPLYLPLSLPLSLPPYLQLSLPVSPTLFLPLWLVAGDGSRESVKARQTEASNKYTVKENLFRWVYITRGS